MEIHILQAGEHLGPFSEIEVRQYLGEGIVAPSDLAICDGLDNWQPLDRLLSHLTPSARTPEMTQTETTNLESPATNEVGPPTTPPEPIDELSETSTGPLPLEVTRSQALSQKTKRKLGKIVLQPILPLEPTAPLGAKKTLKTGKTALTMEPLRPTTALPPVTGFKPKERKSGKALIKTGQLTFGDFGDKAGTSPAPTAPPTSAPVMPPPLPAPVEITAPAPLLPPPTRLDDSEERSSLLPWHQRVPREVLYAGAALAVIILCVIASFIYLIVSHHDGATSTGLVNPDTGPPAHVDTAPANPQTAPEYIARGFATQSKGDGAGAIKDYNEAIKLDPKNALAYFRRGFARQGTGDVDGAFADYTLALSFDSKMADAYSNRAYIKQARHNVDGAIADYTLALQINPKIAAAYFNMGLIKVNKRDLDGAIANYNQAIDLDPKMDVAYFNRGVAKNTEGNLDGAIADYSQAVMLNPKLARAFCARGFCRQSKGDATGALADYTQALALDPKMVDAYYNRGLIRMQQGDLAGAIDDNSQAINLDANNGPAYFQRGLARFGRNNLDDAKDDLKKYDVLMPRESGADLARLYLWLISTEQNPKGPADAELSSALLNDWNSPPEDLTSKIAAFLVGHIKESELIANAASPDPAREPAQYCQVWYFAGMKRLLSGEMNTAISYFQKSLNTNQQPVLEYIFSQAQLKSLGQDRQVSSNATPAPAR